MPRVGFDFDVVTRVYRSIVFSEQHSFKQTVAKAHVRANQIIRCFLSRDPETLVRAFVTYVRSLVE